MMNAPSVLGALCFLSLLTALTSSCVFASPAVPSHYYRFSNASVFGRDSIGNLSLSINNAAQAKRYEEGGICGGYLYFHNKAFPLSLEVPHGQSLEFLFRTQNAGEFVTSGIWLLINTVWELRDPWNSFVLEIPLDQAGPWSLNYASVGWHHIVISADLTTNTVDFCLDGNYCQRGNQTKSFNSLGFKFFQNKAVSSIALDEIAVYDTSLSRDEIYQHYVNVMQDHQRYSFGPKPPPPAPSPIYPKLQYNLSEFAPGTILPSDPVNGTIGVNVSAYDQLLRFPDPQFPTSNPLVMSLFQRNFNWMSPQYMSASGNSGRVNISVALAMRELLYKKWNYGVVLDNLRTCCSDLYVQYIQSASQYTKEFDTIILRLETAGGTQLYNHSLPDSCFLQNKNGDFMTNGGAIVPKSRAGLRPMLKVTAMKVGCPDELFARDGIKFNTSLTALQSLLDKYGAKIARVNNDGEAFNIISDFAMLADPVTRKDYVSSGLPNLLSFWSAWRLRLSRPAFSDIFMNNLPSSAKFTQYQIQGTTPYFGNWTITRHIQSRFMSGQQFYSCSDFYPRDPRTVFRTEGPWHGLDWMLRVRASEIKNGNPWFSPFIAAGWNKMAEVNIRPAQWLGLLKLFGVWGAEFYYSGFFSLAHPFPDPKNWIWQAAMPSYAQAITMQYADEFFNGTFVGFQETGFSNVWCAVRNRTGYRNQPTWTSYIIVLTVQPISNWEGNALLTIPNVEVEVGGYHLQLEARRQGSVYRFVVNGDEKVIDGPKTKLTQLDKWHEASHPYFWRQS